MLPALPAELRRSPRRIVQRAELRSRSSCGSTHDRAARRPGFPGRGAVRPGDRARHDCYRRDFPMSYTLPLTPRKQHRARKILIGAVVIIAAFVGLSAALGTNSTPGSTAPAATAPAVPVATTAPASATPNPAGT